MRESTAAAPSGDPRGLRPGNRLAHAGHVLPDGRVLLDDVSFGTGERITRPWRDRPGRAARSHGRSRLPIMRL